VDVKPAADQISDDVSLEAGECQDEVGLLGQDLVDICQGEGAYARLLAVSLWRAHDIAGDPDEPVLLAKQVQCLDRFFGEQTIRLGGNTEALAYPISRTPVLPDPTRARGTAIKGQDMLAIYAGLIARSFSAVSPRIATRSASLSPGVVRMWSTAVLVQGKG
jgi:hypothetical protein